MQKSRAIGTKAELELVDYLKTEGFDTIVSNDSSDISELSKWDIKAHYQNDWLSFEVKNDLKSHVTGNIAIEFNNCKSNKPSGINATEATFWVHKFLGEHWICLVSELKQFIITEPPWRTVLRRGDDNSDMMIYKVDQIKKLMKPLKEITRDEMFSIYTSNLLSQCKP